MSDAWKLLDCVEVVLVLTASQFRSRQFALDSPPLYGSMAGKETVLQELFCRLDVPGLSLSGGTTNNAPPGLRATLDGRIG